MAEVLWNLNDNNLNVVGLQNKATSAYLNSATVTATLVDAAGTEIVGETWPLTLSYVTGSDGNYRGVLIDTLTTTVNALLTCKITANGGAGLQGYWELPVRVQVRTS